MTFICGAIVSPNLSAHISHGITCIEFYIIMLAVCYYASTRGNITFLAWNYVLLYSFSVFVFLQSPQVVREGTAIRYSLSSNLNVNAFSMGITMAIWSILYLIMLKKINIFFGAGTVGIFLYSILLTGSRKGLIGAAICIILWVFVCYLPLNRNHGIWNSVAKFASVLVISIALLYFIAPIYSGSYMAVRMQSLLNQSDLSTANRISMYRNGFQYTLRSPILGYGFWGFAHFFGGYSHANLIEVPVSSGIPLALLYFATYVTTGKKLLHNRKELVHNESINQYQDQVRIGVAFVLFAMLLFYSISVIHIYEISSFISFAFIYSANDIYQANRRDEYV